VGGLIRWCWVAALIALASGCRGEHYTARLATGDEVQFVKTIKGNDIVVDKQGQLARIRLVGVYAFDPTVREKKDIEAAAKKAAELAATLAKGKTLRVTLELERLDPRGRHLGFLEVDGVDIGRQLIVEGVGSAYTEYSFSREADYIAAEAEARAQARGIWSGKRPTNRIVALRETWAAVRSRGSGKALTDPLLPTVSK
jgi:endonuclease YncB( thermonuclease family)